MNATAMASHDIGQERITAQILASGCLRTRRDAYYMLEQMHRDGWHHSLRPLYHAVLALLGDPHAGKGLTPRETALFEMALAKMRCWWIGNSDCRCLRSPSGQIVRKLSSCPVHSESTADKIWVPGMGFVG